MKRKSIETAIVVLLSILFGFVLPSYSQVQKADSVLDENMTDRPDFETRVHHGSRAGIAMSYKKR